MTGYLCAVYKYAEKAGLSNFFLYRKLGVIKHFSETIKLRFSVIFFKTDG